MPTRAHCMRAAALAGAALLFVGHARAAVVHFGEDVAGGAVPAAFTNLTAARAAFLSTQDVAGTVGFEGMPTGDGLMAGARPPFDVDFGFTTAHIDAAYGHFEVWEHALGGRYPTGGHNYLLMAGHPLLASFVDIVFATPVRAFGLNVTDAGDFAESLRVRVSTAGGAPIVIDIPHLRDSPDANASAFFFGYVADVPIASVRIENTPISAGTPFIAFDDLVALRLEPLVPVGTQLPVPETTTALLMAAGLGVLAALRRRLD